MCGVCRRFDAALWTCDAYPEGVPNALILAGADHRLPLPGDSGLTFQPNDEGAVEYVNLVYGEVPQPYDGPMTVDDPAVDPF